MPDTTILQQHFWECVHASAACAGAEPGNAALRLPAPTSAHACCHAAPEAAGSLSEPAEAVRSTASVRHGWWMVPDVPPVTTLGKRLDWRRQPAHCARRRTPASMPC